MFKRERRSSFLVPVLRPAALVDPRSPSPSLFFNSSIGWADIVFCFRRIDLQFSIDNACIIPTCRPRLHHHTTHTRATIWFNTQTANHHPQERQTHPSPCTARSPPSAPRPSPPSCWGPLPLPISSDKTTCAPSAGWEPPPKSCSPVMMATLSSVSLLPCIVAIDGMEINPTAQTPETS